MFIGAGAYYANCRLLSIRVAIICAVIYNLRYSLAMIECKLEDLLRGKELTAYGLAKQTGLHQSVISKWKASKAKAYRADVLDKLCAALGCQPGDLLVYKPSKKKA